MGIGFMGLALALAPMSLASAGIAKSKSHHKSTSKPKGGTNPGSPFCKGLVALEKNETGIGVNIEKAIESGNFATAKSAIAAAFNQDLKSATSAGGLISDAPKNIQTDFKTILAGVKQIESTIESSSSLQGLESSFETLGENSKFEAAGTQLGDYVTSQCGDITGTATTVSVP
jgi:hypothetical protein